VSVALHSRVKRLLGLASDDPERTPATCAQSERERDNDRADPSPPPDRSF
jgi:hypothetical protein